MGTRRTRARRLGYLLVTALAAVAVVASQGNAAAAPTDVCEGGGFRLVSGPNGAVDFAVGGDVDDTFAAASFGRADRVAVRGRYVEFDVRLTDFAVFDHSFTGAANELDITGGRRTPVFASKLPDHRGLRLTSAIAVQLHADDLVLTRTGPGLSMTIRASDCPQGEIFRMEPQRTDGRRTRIVHSLAAAPDPTLTPFDFDNPNFRGRPQICVDPSGSGNQLCTRATGRVNIANDVSPRFVARDVGRAAVRVAQPGCNTARPVAPSIAHCGGVSIWEVASGGSMAFVSGEAAVDGLGFPFPVPSGSRLVPRGSVFVPLPSPSPPPAS
jgi:hypothetical protein